MYEEEIKMYASDILNSKNFQSTINYIQHGNMSVKEHCESVARVSLAIRDKFKIKCNSRDLVRGALLHDYFLYDWHNNSEEHKLHGFFHPSTALKNAQKEYYITAKQADIISKHMWPLTIIPPMCKEAWIVTMADKYCSTLETLCIQKGKYHKNRTIKNWIKTS